MSQLMVALVFGAALIVSAVAVALAWRSSGSKFPSDETLRHPSPGHAEPLIREQSRHRDTPAGADLDKPGGREHGF